MASPHVPFETTQERRIRNVRRNDQRDTGADPVGYVAVEGGIRGLIGDHIGPYMHAIGRASADGSAGLVSVDDGEAQRLATDELGRLWTRAATAPIPPALPGPTDAGATSFHDSVAASAVVSAVPARLFQLRAIVATAVNADRIIQVHNAAALPANGAVPLWEMFIPAGTGFAEAGDDWDPIDGLICSVGCVLASSTTLDTLTIGAADITFFGSFTV